MNRNAYRLVPISLLTCAACVASRVAWIWLTGMLGSKTVTFAPRSGTPGGGAGTATAAPAVPVAATVATATRLSANLRRSGPRSWRGCVAVRLERVLVMRIGPLCWATALLCGSALGAERACERIRAGHRGERSLG